MYTFLRFKLDIKIYTHHPFLFLWTLTPDERPPLLKGHFCSAEGVASQKG